MWAGQTVSLSQQLGGEGFLPSLPLLSAAACYRPARTMVFQMELKPQGKQKNCEYMCVCMLLGVCAWSPYTYVISQKDVQTLKLLLYRWGTPKPINII